MEGIRRLLGLCLLVIVAGVVKGQICTKDWKLHDDTYYIEVSTKMTHSDAEIHCKAMGADLAILKSPDENEFVKGLSCRPVLGLYRYWIAMDDLTNENDFEWEDGTRLNPWDARWGPGEPNNRWNQDCVSFITSPNPEQLGKWSTDVCSSNLFSLCSKALVLPELLNPPDVRDIGTDSLTLSWQCWNTDEDKGDGPVLGYYVHLNTIQDPTAANWSSVGFVQVGEPCEFVIEHLHINTEYYVAVSVLHEDSKRKGPLGPRVVVSTHDVDLPFLLEPPEATDVGSSYLMLTWTGWTNKNGEGDGPIAGYNVHIMEGVVPRKVGSVIVGDINPEFNVTGLQADRAYQIMITVIYQDGREGPSGPISTVSTSPMEVHSTTMMTTNVMTTSTSDPSPDVIHSVKPCNTEAPIDTILMNLPWIGLLIVSLSFCAGMACMKFLPRYCYRRGNVPVNKDTRPILPYRHDGPTPLDTPPPSYHEAFSSDKSLPYADSGSDATPEKCSESTNTYVCLSDKPIKIIT